MDAQSSESTNIAARQEQLAQQAYGVGVPALQSQMGFIRDARATGEPDYMRQAFESQRGGLSDAAAYGDQASFQKRMAMLKSQVGGGNTSAVLNPSDMGSRLARALSSSRVNEGLGAIEQSNKLLGMEIGQSVQAGNAGLAAGQQQLQAVSMMPNYNPLYASIMGGLNIAGSVYGGFNRGVTANTGSGGMGMSNSTSNNIALQGTGLEGLFT